ncbi:LysR substrate-binding domain-containing protein [Solirubrobacter taibaiensis]|nr:LysR substrate-binding domain-containing protein [Solirubrobacter taibaiensis]
MELRHLRYFIAVAEERHFGRAAARLHMAQPPLSQAIRRFEAELGEPLLYRTTRSVELSPAGEVMLERGREILAAADSAFDDARRAARGEYGRLAIGFTGSSTYALLPALAAAVRAALPGVMLELRGELLTPAQIEHLLDGSLDLGLLRPPVHERDLCTEVVRSERLVAVLPHTHRLASADAVPLAELEHEPFVTYPLRSVVHDAAEDACAAHGFTPIGAHEVGETATLISFVAAGLGVSLVPESVCKMTVEGAVYRPLEQDATRVELAVAWRRDDERPVLVRALDVIRRDLRAG